MDKGAIDLPSRKIQKNITEVTSGIKKAFKILLDSVVDICRHELWLIYEFCEFNPMKVTLVIKNTKPVRIKKLLNEMVNSPNTAQNYIDSIFQKHKELLKAYEEEEDAKMQAELENRLKEEEMARDSASIVPGILSTMPQHFIIDIAGFLDARSLFKLSFTCKEYRGLLLSKSKFIFQKFCKGLYRNIPILPSSTPFNSIKETIERNPRLYSAAIRANVNKDVRKVAWNCSTSLQSVQQLYTTPRKYFEQFSNHYLMFMQAPRIHYGGYYVFKERYTKIGEKDLHHTITPLLQITYYRYFRFFPNGSFTFTLSNRKLKKADIVASLTFDDNSQIYQMDIHDNEDEQNDQEKREHHFGEFVQKEDNVYARFSSAATVFQYDMKIGSSSYGAHNLLYITDYSMYEIPLNHKYTLYKSEEALDSSRIFRYKPNEDIRKTLVDPQFSVQNRMTL